MTGTAVRVRGIKRYFEPKSGKWYCYHRATGERITEDFGTAAFFERVAALDRRAIGVAEERAKGGKGTLRALILAYRADERFTDLAPRTKADYEKCFAFFEPLEDYPLLVFTKAEIIKAVAKWKTLRGRRFVNYCLTVMRLLFAFAASQQLIAENPMPGIEGVRRKKGAPVMNRPWTQEERMAAWERTARPRWQHFRLPFALALFAGLREGDVIRLPKSAVKGRELVHKTAKRQVWVDLSVHAELAQAIREAPAHDAITLVANSRGLPWTESGFRASWRHMIGELEKEGLLFDGCTFHGLRHSLAHTIAEHAAGYDEADIAAVLGQRTATSARAYTVRANRKRRAKEVIANVEPLRRKP
jgi:integrase